MDHECLVSVTRMRSRRVHAPFFMQVDGMLHVLQHIAHRQVSHMRWHRQRYSPCVLALMQQRFRRGTLVFAAYV